MLMVIFGAGASFDSSADYPPSKSIEERPPLANDLFANTVFNRRFRNEFPQFLELIPELLPKPGRSIEDVLQRLQHEGARYPRRLQQLTAIRYYLQSLLSSAVATWLNTTGEATNYRTLIDQIENHRKGSEPLCLVTFNYDTLLESALKAQLGVSFDVMADYVCHPEVKLFKLHGSVDWGRPLGSAPTTLSGTPDSIIKEIERIGISDQIVTTASAPGMALYPAIAIPVTEKQAFECPLDHVEELKKLIPRVTKVITIGWRGMEGHFLNLLRGLPPAHFVTVAGSVDEATETLDRLRSLSVPVRFHELFAGFTDTVGDRKLDLILAS